MHAWAFSQSSTNHVNGPFARNGHMARKNLSGGHIVCYTAVFSTLFLTKGGSLRDDTKNDCVADYRTYNPLEPWKQKIIAIWIIQWNPVNDTVTNESRENWPYKRVTAYRDGRKAGFRCNVISFFSLALMRRLPSSKVILSLQTNRFMQMCVGESWDFKSF